MVHAVLGVPFVIITVSATLQGFNYLVRAAASLGAPPLTTFFRVTLPLIAPGVISGALFAFATSFDEVVVTLFLAGPEQATLPRQMFSGIRENLSPTIAAAAIGFSILLLLTLEWLRGRSECVPHNPAPEAQGAPGLVRASAAAAKSRHFHRQNR